MGDKLGGRWLKPVEKDHECNRPYLWAAKEGQRWQCLAVVDRGPVIDRKCEKVWRVGRHDDGGKGWFPDGGFEQAGPKSAADVELKRFAIATPEEVMYWVAAELSDQDLVPAEEVAKGGRTFPVRQVIQAIQKRYEIGRTQ